jgi:mannosyltransferase OCH1-like enzyme
VIPKKIHYCWFGPKPIPELVHKCISSWKDKLNGYEIVLWNEDNSPMDIQFAREAYSNKKYAFVSDYVRFWVLQREGGIYLDTDMFVLKDFDNLLSNEVFFGWETDQKSSISCGIIGAVPGNKFITDIVKYYENLSFSVDIIPNLVVPRIISKCYQEYKLKEEITIYPFDCFYPFPYEEKEGVKNFMNYRTENTYAIHLWNVSWGTFRDKLRDRILYFLRKRWQGKR